MLKGVLCEDENHRGEEYVFEECLRCSRERGPERKCHVPFQVIKAMSLNQVERKDAGLSATTLVNFCPRKAILQEEEDYFEYPLSYWPRLRGTLSHYLMEHYSEGIGEHFAETRLRKTIIVDGIEIEITGQPDFYWKIHTFLLDFKSTKDVNDKKKSLALNRPQQEHVEQIQIYKWLLWGGTRMDTNEQVFYEVSEAGIMYFDMMEMKKITVDVWSMDKIESYIHERVRPFVEYRKTKELPPIATDAWGNRHILCNYCALRGQCDTRENAS